VGAEKRLCEAGQRVVRDAWTAVTYADLGGRVVVVNPHGDVGTLRRVPNRVPQDVFNRPPQQLRIARDGAGVVAAHDDSAAARLGFKLAALHDVVHEGRQRDWL